MCFWHIIIISIVIIIFRLNASNAVDSFLWIHVRVAFEFVRVCSWSLVADTHFLGQRMGQRRFSWLIEKAKPPLHPLPPQRNQSELELRLDNVPWLIMCDSLKPSSVPGRTYIEINVMAQWAYNIYTLYHIYYAYNMQIELRVFHPIAATCEVCHSPSTPSIQIYINHFILRI